MVVKEELNRKLTDLIIDYKCLSAYSSADEMLTNMTCDCNAFIDVCDLMRCEQYTFKKAQEEVLNSLKNRILFIVVDELYGFI
jgi:hypothetical protein